MLNILNIATTLLDQLSTPNPTPSGDLAGNLESGLSVHHEPAAARCAYTRSIKSSGAAREFWAVAPATPRIALRGVM